MSAESRSVRRYYRRRSCTPEGRRRPRLPRPESRCSGVVVVPSQWATCSSRNGETSRGMRPGSVATVRCTAAGSPLHSRNTRFLQYTHLSNRVKVIGKGNVELYSACTRNISPIKALRYSARVVKGYHSFYLQTLRFIRNRNELYPGRSWYSFTDPGGMDRRLSRPWCEVAPAEIRTCNFLIKVRHSTTQPLAHLLR